MNTSNYNSGYNRALAVLALGLRPTLYDYTNPCDWVRGYNNAMRDAS